MAAKPETNFIHRIHRILPRSIYREKMYNPLRRGTPDVWYSGPKHDIWVEYKYISKIPAILRPDELLSPLQREWILRRLEEGRSIWVIVGSPMGALIYRPERDRLLEISKDEFYKLAISDNRVSTFICDQVS
jgi:hypothetical protein